MFPRCRKRGYRDRIAALVALGELSIRKNREECRVYYCQSCDNFHLTSKGRRR